MTVKLLHDSIDSASIQNPKSSVDFVTQKAQDDLTEMIPVPWYEWESTEDVSNVKYSNDEYNMGGVTEAKDENRLFFKKTEELPCFPSEIYSNLPLLLQDLTNPINNNRHKDIAMLSGLVFCSSLFPDVWADYGGETHYSNLFGMIVAPSSTGKSNIRIGEFLVKEIVKKLQQKYKQEYAEFKRQGEGSEMPEPIEKTLIMSANTSDSALIDSLAKNEGLGIIYTNEMDAQASNEWANLSPIFRQIFDHQLISKDRVKSSTHIESPKCSILYSGTPGQFNSVISDFENGLHQRFLMYHFTSDLKWRSPFNIGFNLDKLGNDVYQNHLAGLLSNYESKPIEFTLTEEQQVRFDSYFAELLEDVKTLSKKPIYSLITRGGKMAHKIAMVLTILRNPNPTGVIYCSDVDFSNAVQIFDTVVRHSIFLATVKSVEYCPPHLDAVLGLIKSENQSLSYSDLKNLADGKNIPSSTLTQHLRQLVQLGFLVKERHGIYSISTP